jgi:hypothetical protein
MFGLSQILGKKNKKTQAESILGPENPVPNI